MLRTPGPVSQKYKERVGTITPVDCVYINVAGPMNAFSFGTGRYAVTPVSEYRGFSLLLLSYYKSEAPSAVSDMI